MKEISIFFIFGYNQKLIFDSIIKYQFNNSKVVVIYTIKNLTLPDHIKSIYIGNIRLNFSRIIFLRKQLSYIMKELQGSESISVYTPHVINFLSNYFVINYPKRIKRFLIYDGILNLNEPKGKYRKWLIFQIAQYMKALMFGLKYNFIFGPITGRHFINYCEFFLPKEIENPYSNLSSSFVSIYSSDNKIINNICIFLEQPILNKQKEYLLNLSNYLQTFSFERIIIKPHPMLAKSIVFDYLRSMNLEVDLFCESISAEELTYKISPKTVISSNSSALINIKKIFQSTKVISFGLKYCTSGDASRLIKLFIKYDIQIC
jgi:hypothetical protein